MSTTLTPPTSQTVLLATFVVQGALYALDAVAVQEVIRLGPLTPVRFAPDEIVGILNLRGRIVTIFDLGQRLGFPKAVTGAESRIFIVEDRNEFIGLLVDRVDEVVEVDRSSWQLPPANVNRVMARFLKGVYRVGGRVITLLDSTQILSENGQ